eukprot:938338-Amorphochlora_amoeboformis.AAC.1
MVSTLASSLRSGAILAARVQSARAPPTANGLCVERRHGTSTWRRYLRVSLSLVLLMAASRH